MQMRFAVRLIAFLCVLVAIQFAFAESRPAETQPADLKPTTQGVIPKSVVFVVDASGSMINKFSTLKSGLSSALAKLMPDESFEIVVFKDRDIQEFKGGLQPATAENIKRANIFLHDIATTGTTDPLCS